MIADFWDQPLMVQRNMGYAVRTARAGSPTLLKEIQQAVWSVNADLPVARVRTLDQLRSESMAPMSFMLVMLVIAAAVALLLGVVGIDGVSHTSRRSARAKSGFEWRSARKAGT